jgi:hypothetical protein
MLPEKSASSLSPACALFQVVPAKTVADSLVSKLTRIVFFMTYILVLSSIHMRYNAPIGVHWQRGEPHEACSEEDTEVWLPEWQ